MSADCLPPQDANHSVKGGAIHLPLLDPDGHRRQVDGGRLEISSQLGLALLVDATRLFCHLCAGSSHLIQRDNLLHPLGTGTSVLNRFTSSKLTEVSKPYTWCTTCSLLNNQDRIFEQISFRSRWTLVQMIELQSVRSSTSFSGRGKKEVLDPINWIFVQTIECHLPIAVLHLPSP